MFKKLISIINFCPQSVLKHSVVHFSRYWNENLFFFLMSKYVEKTNFYHQFLSTISFKTFSGSFSRYRNDFFKRENHNGKMMQNEKCHVYAY